MSTLVSTPKPRSRLVHTMRMIGAFALLVVGGVLAIPGVPGPGIPIILLGLLLLSDHFAWARKALVWLREKAAGVRRNINRGRWNWSTTCPDKKGRTS
jgi:hypothetical protein